MADFAAALAGRQSARYFELKGRGLEVKYYTLGVPAVPYMWVTDEHGQRGYSGHEITIQGSPLGTLVTVSTAVIIDADSHTLTLILPAVNLPDSGTSKVGAIAILTTHRNSFAGPGILDGPLELYKSVALKGVANAGIPREG
jgi:hypothetical protein